MGRARHGTGTVGYPPVMTLLPLLACRADTAAWAVDALREAVVTLGSGTRWRARRVVEASEVARCAALQAESLVDRGADPAPHRALIERRLTAAAEEATDVLVTIEVSGACQGFVWTSLRTLRTPVGDTLVCHLNSIVLARAARGEGLGGEVMAHLEEGARAAGFAAMSLNSVAANHRVADYYARLGYTRVGLDLEKVLAGSTLLPPEPSLQRVPHREPPGAGPDTTPLRDAFEPSPAGSTPPPTERFEREGALVGLVGTTLRRAADGTSIVVFDPFFVTPAGSAEVRGIVADREHAARASGAERAYVTIWEPGSPVARALQDLGDRVGRHKWWKDLSAARA